MGKNVALHVANRFGKVILELGGNNFSIITSNANMDIAIPSCVFAAIGTTGQRCTTLRRLFVHTDVYDDVVQRMVSAYKSIRVGNPYDTSTLIGPLVNVKARDVMHLAIANAIDQGGTVTCGGKTLQFQGDDHCYVEPCIIESPQVLSISKQETFAPILYIVPYTDLDDAIRMGNDVPQGLSSSIFTDSIVEAEYFLPRAVTGIVNINASTSGAEIGGAFGGEKETGGGRESGSDAWKQYMRRVTTTINGGTVVTLAQGIVFE
jgi:aldehyde dehydrogenase (NAD+)